MLLLPSDTGRRGLRTTEFWVCAATEVALLSACLLADGAASASAAISAAAIAIGYCMCRTALKCRVAKAGGEAVEAAMSRPKGDEVR